MGRLTYKELSKQKFKEQRNIVISEAFDKENKSLGYSINKLELSSNNE